MSASARPGPLRGLVTCARAGKILLRVFAQSGSTFYRADGFRMASSLSFQTLVSIVPASLFLLWSLRTIHPDMGMGKLLDLLRPFFFPEMIDEVMETIGGILEKINFAAIGWIGATLAFFATFSLSLNVKGCLDRLFNIRQEQLPLLRRLAIATVVVILMPLYVWFTYSETRLMIHIPSGLYLFRPYFVTILTLYLVYRYMPERPPRAWGALLGSLLAGIFLEAERFGLAMYFSFMHNVYLIIYGALFILPLFLLWLYLSWVIFLSGATFSSAIEKLIYERKETAAT